MCLQAIEDWLGRNGTSTITRNAMSVQDLTLNRGLRQSIQETVALEPLSKAKIDKGFIYVGFSEYDYEQNL